MFLPNMNIDKILSCWYIKEFLENPIQFPCLPILRFRELEAFLQCHPLVADWKRKTNFPHNPILTYDVISLITPSQNVLFTEVIISYRCNMNLLEPSATVGIGRVSGSPWSTCRGSILRHINRENKPLFCANSYGGGVKLIWWKFPQESFSLFNTPVMRVQDKTKYFVSK